MKSKEGPIQAARRINIKALFMFKFLAKMSLKSPAKFNERTGPGYPEAARGPGYLEAARGPRYLEAARCPGSSGNAGQLL